MRKYQEISLKSFLSLTFCLNIHFLIAQSELLIPIGMDEPTVINACPNEQTQYQIKHPNCAQQQGSSYQYYWIVQGGDLVQNNGDIVTIRWHDFESNNGFGEIIVSYSLLTPDETCNETENGGSYLIEVNIYQDPGFGQISGNPLEITQNCLDFGNVTYEGGNNCRDCGLFASSDDGTTFEFVSNISNLPGLNNISFTLDELPKRDGSNYGFDYQFKVIERDPLCSSFTTESNTIIFTFYPPPPEIESIPKINPTCFGESGSITVNHGPIESNENFVYTVTKLIPGSDCGTYSDDTPKGPVIYDENSFCEGFIANYTNTGQVTTIELTGSTFIPKLGSTESFNLEPGFYLLEIESERTFGDENLPKCILDTLIEIGEPPYIPFTVSDLTIEEKKPSCNGNNDGELSFSIDVGVGKGSFQWKKVDSTAFIDVTNDLLGFSGGDYSIDVLDQCDTITYSQEIDEGEEHKPSIIINEQPICDDEGKITVSKGNYENLNNYDIEFKLEGSAYQSSGSFTGLNSGDTKVYMLINDKCESSNIVTLDPVPDISISLSKETPDCKDGLGSLIFSSSDENLNFNYTITGDTTSLNNKTLTSQNFTDDKYILPLYPGEYSVLIENNCKIQTVINQSIVISNISSVTISDIYDQEVSCYDERVGPISFSVNQGTPPYTVNISRLPDGTGYDSEAFTVTEAYQVDGLPFGDYTVTATDDDCGISFIEEFSITLQNSSEVDGIITYSPTYYPYLGGYDIQCTGESNGKVGVTVSGGNPYESGDSYGVTLKRYNDDFEQSADSANGDYYEFQSLSAGNYYLVITDENNCTRNFSVLEDTIKITEPPQLLSISQISQNAFTNASVSIFQDSLFVKCHNGTVTFNPDSLVSGGVEDYTFYLDNVAFSEPKSIEIFDVESVTKTFKVIDQNGCEQSQSFTIYNPPLLQVNLEDLANFSHGQSVQCYGDNNGSIRASATGGKGSYNYYLDDDIRSGESGSVDFENLEVGENPVTYTIRVQDEFGCEVQKTIELTPPEPVELTNITLPALQNGVHILCKGETAEVSFSFSGGTDSNFELFLSKDNEPFETQGELTLVNLTSGDYRAYVEDELGCSSDISEIFTITEPADPVTINGNFNEIHPNCIGGNDGQFKVTATGGVGGFQYRIDGGAWQDSIFQNLQADDYFLEVVDANNCLKSANVTIPDNPNPLTLELITKNDPSCHHGTDGSIEVSTTNFNLKTEDQLLYRISGGHYGTSIYDTLVDFSSSATEHSIIFENLWDTKDPDFLASHYEVWVEDVHQCLDTAFQYLSGPQMELSAPESIEFDVWNNAPPSCYGWENGFFTIKASGGTGGYEYQINNQGFTTSNTGDESTYLHDSIRSGTYTIQVIDDSYDSSQPTCLVEDTFDLPDGFYLDLSSSSIQNVSCIGEANGALDIQAMAYYPYDEEFVVYAYDDSDLETYLIDGTDTLSFDNLSKGNYTVSTRYSLDSVTCVQPFNFSVLGPTKALSITNFKTYPSACGSADLGKIVLDYEGGWADSTAYYSLDNGSWNYISGSSLALGNLNVGEHYLQLSQSELQCSVDTSFEIVKEKLTIEAIIVNGPSCSDGNDGRVVLASPNIEQPEYLIIDSSYISSSGDFQGLPFGEYQFVARDALNPSCTSDTLTFSFTECTDYTDIVVVNNVPVIRQSTCLDSNDGQAIIDFTGGLAPFTYLLDDTEIMSATITDIAYGNHKVVVIDAAGKKDSSEVFIDTLESISIDNIVTTQSTCSGYCDGAISAMEVSGGSGSYRIEWVDGYIGGTRSDLCPGVYEFTVYDDLSDVCSISGSVNITEYDELSVLLSSAVSPTCFEGTNGSLEVQATGGTNTFSYEWSDGTVGRKLEDISAGDYSVTVTDNNLGCVLTEQFTLSDRPLITVSDTLFIQPSCVGGSDGKIQLIISNASNPFIEWDNGQIGATANGLSAGAYGFTVSNSSGCQITGEVTLTDRIPLEVSSTVTNNTCYGACSGSIGLSISGGLSPYYIEWNTGSRSKNLTGLCSGNYTYTVTDRLGCEITDVISISSPPQLIVELLDKSNVLCYEESNGFLEVEALGGTGPYTYSWSNGENSPLASQLSEGDYTVMVTDSFGCTVSQSYSITQPGILFTSGDIVSNPSCFGYNDGSIDVNPVGGTAPYSYKWSNGGTTQKLSSLEAGRYDLVLTDANGCEYTKSYSLSDPSSVTTTNVTITDPLCHDDANGSVELRTLGGTAPYTYLWSTGDATEDLMDVTSGTYELSIVDDQGCEFTESFELTNPEIPIISGLDDIMVTCDGGSLLLDPDGIWSSYQWEGPDGISSTANTLEISEEGEYRLTVTDEDGCPSSKMVLLEVSENALVADFIRISEAIAFEPLVFIDLSLPIPDEVQWIIPNDSRIVVNEMDQTSIELVFTEAGDYEIGLEALSGTCRSEVFKVINISEATGNESLDPNGRTTSIHTETEVGIYPNPTRDKLNLKVESANRDKITIQLLDVSKDILYETELKGRLDYLVNWDMSSSNAGVYILVIQSGKKVQTKRVVTVR